MTRCTNPRCSRQSKLLASAVTEIWGRDEAPTCVQCFIALAHGTNRSTGEVSFSVMDDADLKENDVQEIVNADV